MTEDKYALVHDAAGPMFDSIESPGITVDEDGEAEFDWSEVPVVHLDEPPHARAFDTDEFYKIEGATVARPIRQPYRVGDDVDVYMKPADELRDAAWSMDNRPYTLGHPSSGMVKDVADVHGFWRNPRYDDEEDRLLEDLYIPKGDEEAMEFVSQNQDVSIGFYNRVYSEYDGDIGGLVDPEEEHLDGYQANIYTDHIAGVERGRCSSEHGCGLDDSHDHGTVLLRTDETTSFLTKEGQTKKKDTESGSEPNRDDMDYDIAPLLDTDAEWTCDYTEDGEYFAVAPDENSDGEPKFPINSCSDVDDAWKLRGHGDIDISQDTLEERIQRKARDLGCEVPGTEESGDTHMTDTDTDDESGGFDLPDLSIDAVAEKHEAVRELRDAKDDLETDLETVRDGLGLDEDECPCEADLDAYADAKDTVEALYDEFKEDDVDLVDFVKDMHEEWQDAREQEREELLDDLEELKADREEWEDESLDDLREERDRRAEIAEDFDASGISEDTDTDDTEHETYQGKRVLARGEHA